MVGHKYALTLICDLTKYLITIPLKTKSANEVGKAIFEHFILTHGPMKVLRSDRGTDFCNEIIDELCKYMKISKEKSTAYHHQTLGSVERNHRTFNEYIRTYLDSELNTWDTYLHYFTFCYNITNHSSNDNKYSPFELVFGRKVNLQDDFLSVKVHPVYDTDNYAKTQKYLLMKTHNKTREILNKIKARNKAYYDKTAKPLTVNTGDLVYVEREPYNHSLFNFDVCLSHCVLTK